jgi:hypothetical protein
MAMQRGQMQAQCVGILAMDASAQAVDRRESGMPVPQPATVVCAHWACLARSWERAGYVWGARAVAVRRNDAEFVRLQKPQIESESESESDSPHLPEAVFPHDDDDDDDDDAKDSTT